MRLFLKLLTVAIVAGSCATTEPPRTRAERAAQAAAEAEAESALVIETDASLTQGPGIEGVEIYPGSGRFIDEEAAQPRVRELSEDGEIVLNFEAESVQSVVHTILGEVLQETFVIGPGVSGQVTFSTARPVTREQLMPILELLLRWNGATLVYTEGRYHVLPVSEAVRGHLVPRLGGSEDVMGYEVRVVPLEYISAPEMAKILEPYVRESAIVSVDAARSMLFLAGTREEIRNYLETVEIFDVDWLAGMSVGIYPLTTVGVDAISTELMAIFGTEGESPLAGLFRFVPLERLGSVMVITPREEYLEKAREWIERLDRGAAGAGTQLFVYRVKNLEASVLAGYLTQLFGGATTGRQQGRSPRGMLAPGLQEVQVGTVSDFNRNRLGAEPQGEPGTGGIVDTEQGEIRITSVLETNSLLIQATQSQYDNILAAIRRIDEEPLQVLIEAQVIDVTLNDTLQFGVNWFLTNDTELIPNIDTGDFGDVIGSAGLTGGTFFSTLGRVSGGGKSFVELTIAALDAVSDVRTIAAPSLLVRNNAAATITVGTQVPVQSSSISTGNDNVVSSAQYVSTGVTLDVTPRINPGGLVYLTITQDVSFPGERDPDISVSGNPPINNKTVSSEVAVQSGQTVFLGGLISQSSSVSETGLPGVSRIPIIGRLFGSKVVANDRTETLVMLTPTVIQSAADLEAVSEDMRKEFKDIQPIRLHTLQE